MIRHLSRPALVLLALLVPACNRNSRVSVEAFQQLQVGQSETQTIDILGPPGQVVEVSGERTLTWVNRNLTVIAHFRDSKLTRRTGTLDGLPLVAEVAKSKAAETPESDPPAVEPEPRYPT